MDCPKCKRSDGMFTGLGGAVYEAFVPDKTTFAYMYAGNIPVSTTVVIKGKEKKRYLVVCLSCEQTFLS